LADVKAQDNESFESLLKRFNRKVQHGGILSEARRRAHYQKPPTRRKRKEAAKRRMASKMARNSR